MADFLFHLSIHTKSIPTDPPECCHSLFSIFSLNISKNNFPIFILYPCTQQNRALVSRVHISRFCCRLFLLVVPITFISFLFTRSTSYSSSIHINITPWFCFISSSSLHFPPPLFICPSHFNLFTVTGHFFLYLAFSLSFFAQPHRAEDTIFTSASTIVTFRYTVQIKREGRESLLPSYQMLSALYSGKWSIELWCAPVHWLKLDTWDCWSITNDLFFMTSLSFPLNNLFQRLINTHPSRPRLFQPLSFPHSSLIISR